MPPNFGIGMVLRQDAGHLGLRQDRPLVAGYGRAFGMQVQVWGSEASRERARPTATWPQQAREAFFESLRRAERAPAPDRRDARHRDAGRPVAHEAHGAVRQHLARRAGGDNALVSALNRGRPGMAAVDVFESEPILQGHPLLRLENAVCTPHIGYVEQDSYELYFGAAFDNVVNFINNTPTNLVNPEALKVLR
jgi:D-3-phosphoglycerate dehydrogenase / 2-oxoglutarate reductase